MPKVMSAAEFKARCLEVLDRVAEDQQPVVVTKRGRPVAQVVPILRKPKRLYGAMRGEIDVLGDIVGPVDDGWEVARS